MKCCDTDSTVNDGVKEAMKAKDKEKLAALRGIKAVFQSSAKDKGVDTLSDEECIAVLRKLAKQRQESVDAYVQAGRDELAANEKSELDVINTFLPALADEATTRKWVEEAIADSGATSASMMGKVMGALMKKHKGEMDGTLAKTIAEDIFKNGGGSGAAPTAEAAPKKAKEGKPPAAKEDKKAAEKSEHAPAAAPAAPAAADEEPGRMVWRQGFYLDGIWQRGRYAEMKGASALAAPAAAPARY